MKKIEMVDASELMKYTLYLKEKGTPEQKEHFLNVLKKAFNEEGKRLIDRAIKEKLITILEWADMMQDYGLDYTDFSNILSAYFSQKDHPSKETIHIVTITDSNMFKAREFIKKKFNVSILLPEEAMILMEKEGMKK